LNKNAIDQLHINIMSMIISINGNIGSGKTNFIKKLKQEVIDNNLENIIVLEDRINQLSKISIDDIIIFEELNNTVLQLMLLITRFKLISNIIETNPNAIIICESCLMTDIEIFIKILCDKNEISSYLSQTFMEWFNDFNKNLPELKSIYLYSTPKNILLRMLKKKNNNIVDIAYLTKRHEYYQEIFTDNKNMIIKINIDKYNMSFDDIIDHKYNKLISDTLKLFQNDNLNNSYYFKYNKMYNEDISDDLNMVSNYLVVTIVILLIIFIYIIFN
jgi:thymidylate kinase